MSRGPRTSIKERKRLFFFLLDRHRIILVVKEYEILRYKTV